MATLRPYQAEAAAQLHAALATHGAALDASDCGTGKTYTACEVAKRLGLPLVIVCPKSIIPGWKRVTTEFGLVPICIANYEQVRMGNTICGKPYGDEFFWTVPHTSLIVFDEVHRCKGLDSQNSKLLIGAWNNRKYHRVLMLSATAACSPLEMKAIGYVLGLHKLVDFWPWAFKNKVVKLNYNRFIYTGEAPVLEFIHHQIFPGKGVRVRIPDLGDQFPENEVIAEAYDTGATEDINQAYETVKVEIEKLQGLQALSRTELAHITRARQIAEMRKVPVLAEMIEDLVREGKSVVVFVNYLATMDELTKATEHHPRIFGGQTAAEREWNINAFQENKFPVLQAIIQAGGQAISLHDLDGKHPRVALICPSFSAIDLKQALGRIYRSGGLSKCIQKIIYAAGTIEETICTKVQKKLDCIDTLNDADLI